jgi:hypothetical protein
MNDEKQRNPSRPISISVLNMYSLLFIYLFACLLARFSSRRARLSVFLVSTLRYLSYLANDQAVFLFFLAWYSSCVN